MRELFDQTSHAAPLAGELTAALSRAVVQIHRMHTGRGPSKVQAFFRHDVLVVMLEDVATTAERTLLLHGRRDAIAAGRRELYATMREALVAAVERETGCRVTAVMGDTDCDADVVAHVFVLDRPVEVSAVR